jgi:hypothetical protein
MVNVGFPKPAIHGFEMVDAAIPPHRREAVINRKFTPDPVHAGFPAELP